MTCAVKGWSKKKIYSLVMGHERKPFFSLGLDLDAKEKTVFAGHSQTFLLGFWFSVVLESIKWGNNLRQLFLLQMFQGR